MKKFWIYFLCTVLIFCLWEYYGQNNNLVRLMISSPSFAIEYFLDNHSVLLEATLVTFYEAIAGLFIATAFSFTMMIICFLYPRLMDYILPVMVTSQVIPLIVLAPFFIILFGIGFTSKIAMAALLCFFPVFVNFSQGFKSISSNIHEMMQIYNAPISYRIWNVYIPLSMPNILAGLKISSTLCIIGAIVAEFSGSESGLGKNLFISALRLEPELMMSSLFLSSFIGIILFQVIKLVENFFSKGN